jgi:hypothetical protein
MAERATCKPVTRQLSSEQAAATPGAMAKRAREERVSACHCRQTRAQLSEPWAGGVLSEGLDAGREGLPAVCACVCLES